MNGKTEVELKNFFIFNSGYEANEGEEYTKILYYHPSTDEINTQVNNVGLVEALIKFTGNFKPNAPVNALHTEKKRQLYYQPEKNYWMVMTLNLPYVSKSRNDSTYNEYQEEALQDNVYEAVLKQAYSMYRLFSGTYASTEQNSDVSTLRTKLEHFYSAYLKTLKLLHCDVLNVFGGIHFLPLDKQNFLNVQCFVNSLECNYPYIRNVSFLYNDSLIWSGLEPNEVQIIYQYLVGTLLPAHMETELQGGSIPRNPTSPFASLHYGRFVTGPSNLKTATSVGKVPKIYLNSEKGDGDSEVYYFVVYRALSSSVCLFIDGNTELTLDLFKELDEYMGPKLSLIASDIAEYCSKHITQTNVIDNNAPRFIYFNKLNLAYKSTVHLDNRQTGNVACSKECIKIMADMNSKKSALGHAGETIVKTMNDYWVVGKLSNLREFYVVLQQKNARLIDISVSSTTVWLQNFIKKFSENEIDELKQIEEAVNDMQPDDCINVAQTEEVKKICDTELRGIFFHPL